MAQSKARAMRQALIGHTAEAIRLHKQASAISRTTIHYRYDMTPSVVNRYMGFNRTVCISKVVRTPNQSTFLPASKRLPKF